MSDLTRRQLRYWCFRFKTEHEGGDPANGSPPGLRDEVEAHPYFGGWEQFGVSWDFADGSVETIVPLRYSLEQDWNTQAWANAKDLPTLPTEE